MSFLFFETPLNSLALAQFFLVPFLFMSLFSTFLSQPELSQFFLGRNFKAHGPISKVEKVLKLKGYKIISGEP